MATNKRRRVDDDENNATAAANAPPGAPTTPATTNSGGTPGLKGAKPGDSSGSEGTLAGANGAANKKRRMAWSAEATALGYEAGTIKNSAYVLLAQSGVAGMTVAAIVEAATKQGYVGYRPSCLSAFLSLPRDERASARLRSNRETLFDESSNASFPPFFFFFFFVVATFPVASRPSHGARLTSLSPRLFPGKPHVNPTDCTAGARARPPTTA